jgi:hypothetical protein
MKKQKINLDCGYEVKVIALDIRRTYGEFLAGEPTLRGQYLCNRKFESTRALGQTKNH